MTAIASQAAGRFIPLQEPYGNEDDEKSRKKADGTQKRHTQHEFCELGREEVMNPRTDRCVKSSKATLKNFFRHPSKKNQKKNGAHQTND